ETGGDPSKLADVKYGLLHPFIEGMLDVARPGAKIVDGYELSYQYRDPKEFADARQQFDEKLPALVSDPAKYRKSMSLSFGLWMDYDWRKKGWDTTDVAKNYFTPELFENSVRCALKQTDEFVWVYT